jgi:hypothetical protein
MKACHVVAFASVLEPALDLGVEVTFGKQLIQTFAHFCERRRRRLEPGKSCYNLTLVGSFDLLGQNVDLGTQPLLHVGLNDGNAERELFHLCPGQSSDRQSIAEALPPTAPIDQHRKHSFSVDLETRNHARRFEITELELETDSAVEKPRTIDVRRFPWGRLLELHELGKLKVTGKERQGIDNSHDFFHDLGLQSSDSNQLKQHQQDQYQAAR